MQYQGFRSYAEILKARGNVDDYNIWMAKANDILHMFRKISGREAHITEVGGA